MKELIKIKEPFYQCPLWSQGFSYRWLCANPFLCEICGKKYEESVEMFGRKIKIQQKGKSGKDRKQFRNALLRTWPGIEGGDEYEAVDYCHKV